MKGWDLAKVNRTHTEVTPRLPSRFPFSLVFFWEIVADWVVSQPCDVAFHLTGKLVQALCGNWA